MQELQQRYIYATNKKDWEKLLLVLNSYLERDRDYYWEGSECQYIRILTSIIDFRYGWCTLNEMKNRVEGHTKLDLKEFLTKY